VAVEGDSTDRGATRAHLIAESHGFNFGLRTHNHGRPFYGSVEHPDRMESLSTVCNAMLDSVAPSDDVVVYVESDLVWDPATIHYLINLLVGANGKYAVVSPLIFAGQLFYDVWAFRGLDGQRFSPFPPFHSSLNGHRHRHFTSDPIANQLVEVSSVGSCLVMSGEAARTVRVSDGGALVGWCKSAREHGHCIAIAPELAVRHPA
jgi:hypothetical protein